MERWLGRYSDVAYALMRAVAGFLFACHGAQKLFGVLGGESMLSNPLMATAGVIEFFGEEPWPPGLWAAMAPSSRAE